MRADSRRQESRMQDEHLKKYRPESFKPSDLRLGDYLHVCWSFTKNYLLRSPNVFNLPQSNATKPDKIILVSAA